MLVHSSSVKSSDLSNPLPTPVALLPKASLGYRRVSATVALPQRSPATQGGCFPSALESAHSTFHHLVTATLSSVFINKKIQLHYSCPRGVQQEKEP